MLMVKRQVALLIYLILSPRSVSYEFRGILYYIYFIFVQKIFYKTIFFLK